MNPVFPYHGGKRRMLKYILPLIPEHKTYIEPFAGGLAVFLAKKRCKVEVVNDYNREIANFYRYVKFHCASLIDELEWYLHSRENFMLLMDNPGLTELQRAARWYLLKVCSFGGLVTLMDETKEALGDLIKTNISANFRVKRTFGRCLHRNKDWEEVVEFFDSEEAFTYFDPPYCTGGCRRL